MCGKQHHWVPGGYNAIASAAVAAAFPEMPIFPKSTGLREGLQVVQADNARKQLQNLSLLFRVSDCSFHLRLQWSWESLLQPLCRNQEQEALEMRWHTVCWGRQALTLLHFRSLGGTITPV